ADVLEDSDFTAGLLGTQEVVDGAVVGGMDWLYRDDSPDIFPTTQTGSQIVSWWTLKSGRSTYVHVTNTAEEDPSDASGCDEGVSDAVDNATQYVHVEVLGEDCTEIINFCDVYTP
ncbi:MAG: hypothetical protein GTO02_03605, partial [Candidatus Dadabacteria bacterium]|nr:hypothetical protein [Candidatus Dadabacteria bacterium]NIQ13513.1 hypothetical protein [Candidatus Dadabacteria bacterium]